MRTRHIIIGLIPVLCLIAQAAVIVSLDKQVRESQGVAIAALAQTKQSLDTSKDALETAETWELIAGGALAELEQAKAACRRAIHFVGSR